MTETIYRYKFLNGRKSANGDITWRKNKWEKTKGELNICNNGFHCSKHIQDALRYVQGDMLAIVEVRGKSIIQDDKECWQEMRVVKSIPFKKEHAVKTAIFASRLCLHIYETEYPKDKRPLQAIEAAEKYLDNPTEENRVASRAASWAAWAASGAASEAASGAAWAASAASEAAYGAAWAASAASRAASKQQIHDYMVELMGAKI